MKQPLLKTDNVCNNFRQIHLIFLICFFLLVVVFVSLSIPSKICSSSDIELLENSYGKKNSATPKILVAYATRAGSTAQIAQKIGQILAAQGAAVDVLPLKNVTDLNAYRAAVLGSAWFWEDLRDRHSFASKAYRYTVFLWAYSLTLGSFLRLVAVGLIAGPFAGACDRFKRKLAATTTALVAAPAFLIAVAVAAQVSGLPVSMPRPAGIAVSLFERLALAASQGLGWTYLTLRLNRAKANTFRQIMWLGFIPVALTIMAEALDIALVLGNPLTWASGPVFVLLDQPAWWDTLFRVRESWFKYGQTSCHIVMLVLLWAYVRKLDSALRRKA